MSKKILKQYFSEENIRLAFNRYVRSVVNFKHGRDRSAIMFFVSDLDNNIRRLSSLLISGEFKPSVPFKYFLPKKITGLTRTNTLLSVADAIVYQCIVDRIAFIHFDLLQSNNKFSFAYQLHDVVQKDAKLLFSKNKNKETKKLRLNVGKYQFFKGYKICYNEYSKTKNNIINQHKKLHVLSSDISSFYDNISHDILRKILIDKFNLEDDILNILFDCLDCWSGFVSGCLLNGRGLPQGPQPSAFLAEIFLMDLDEAFIAQSPLGYIRYVDDILIFQNSKNTLLKNLSVLDLELKKKGLAINSQKTNIQNISTQEQKQKVLSKSVFHYQEISLDVMDDFTDNFSKRQEKKIESLNISHNDTKELKDLEIKNEAKRNRIARQNAQELSNDGQKRSEIIFSDIDFQRDFDKKNNLSVSVKNKYQQNVDSINLSLKKIQHEFLDSDIWLDSEKDDIEANCKELYFTLRSYYFKNSFQEFLNKEVRVVDFDLVINFLINLIQAFPFESSFYIYFLSQILKKHSLQNHKSNCWDLYEKMNHSSFIRHYLVKDVLSDFNLNYNRQELVGIYTNYILSNSLDCFSKMSIYFLLLVHVDVDDQLHQSILNRLKLHESCFVKRFVVLELNYFVKRNRHLFSQSPKKRKFNKFLVEYDPMEMAQKLNIKLSLL